MTRSSKLSAVALALGLGVLAACSGQGATPLGGPSGEGSGLPCCYAGYIHRCASEAALDRCSAESSPDTTDCTKTATTCGGGAPPSGGDEPGEAKDAGPSKSDPKKKDVGTTCDVNEECSGELCLSAGGNAGFCSKACSNNTECPSQYLCAFVSKLGIKACVQRGDAKIGESCNFGSDCQSTVCLGTSAGYCSGACVADAECPTSWHCSPVGGADGKFCVKP